MVLRNSRDMVPGVLRICEIMGVRRAYVRRAWRAELLAAAVRRATYEDD